MDPVRFEDMIPGCYDPVVRARDLLSDGIRGSVCFPTFPRFAGVRFLTAKDKELADACVRAYNDFMLDEWSAVGARDVHPDDHRPAVGSGGVRRGGATVRGQGRPRRLVPGEHVRDRPSVVPRPPLGSAVGGGHRDRRRDLHPHRHERSDPDAVARRRLRDRDRARPRECPDHAHRPAAERDPAPLPDDQVRDVRGRDRLGAVRPRTRRSDVGEAPLLGQDGRRCRRARSSAATSGSASSTNSSASRPATTSASIASCGSATTRTPTRRGRTASATSVRR